MGVGWWRLKLVVLCCVVCGKNVPTVMFLPYHSHRSRRSHQSTVPVPPLQSFPPFPHTGYIPNLSEIFMVHTDDDGDHDDDNDNDDNTDDDNDGTDTFIIIIHKPIGPAAQVSVNNCLLFFFYY